MSVAIYLGFNDWIFKFEEGGQGKHKYECTNELHGHQRRSPTAHEFTLSHPKKQF